MPSLQIDAGMKGEQGEHMVKEAHAGIDVALAAAIQVQLDEDLGLLVSLCSCAIRLIMRSS